MRPPPGRFPSQLANVVIRFSGSLGLFFPGGVPFEDIVFSCELTPREDLSSFFPRHEYLQPADPGRVLSSTCDLCYLFRFVSPIPVLSRLFFRSYLLSDPAFFDTLGFLPSEVSYRICTSPPST